MFDKLLCFWWLDEGVLGWVGCNGCGLVLGVVGVGVVLVGCLGG
jgi:hypothetical protein